MKHREGTNLECELPEDYDDRTQIAIFNNKIVVCHPDFPPCILHEGKLTEIIPCE